MLKTLRKAEYVELVILFFIQAMAASAWTVSLGMVLDAHGLHAIKALAFAATAIAAFISPLIFGAMADRHVPPVRVLRWLALATALTMSLVSTAIKFHCNQWLILALLQLLALANAPLTGISSAIVLARLADSKEFAPIRLMMTLGWMAGCVLVSLLGVDTSALSGYAAATLWVILAAFTFFLPPLEVPKSAENLSWHERLGLDALTLLKNRDHRVIFFTTTLLNIPLSAFYPYAPTNLRNLGFTHASAWMALAQVSEVIAMASLGWLLGNWRLKWIFICGLIFGVLRFAFSAINTKTWLLIGVGLHGASYALVFVTAQIYLDQRVESSWRARAQALLTLMNNGVGYLIGYLGMGWWFAACVRPTGTQWSLFWGGLATIAAMVLIYFLAAYRGTGANSQNQSA
ncbi:MAG TPA: MFS transporter [Verrucomicrobiae bacterium]|nr:MFS transporter [Verrucomicrobiae bacterium]